MMIDTKGIAKAIIDAAYRAPGQVSIDVDIGVWTAQQVQDLMQAILGDLDDYQLRVKGIVTDSSGFDKVGAQPDASLNGGKVGNIPVVKGLVPFDSFKIVLEKAAK